MADEPDNLILRLLREMREENRQMREENRQMRVETKLEIAEVQQQIAEMRTEFTVVLETVVDMAKVVNKTAEAVADLNGRVGRVEKRLDAPNGRALN
jgi:uncharacterized membrane protein